MRIVIIGATGTIGKAVKQQLESQHEVVSVGSRNGDYTVDIGSVDSITRLYDQVGEFDALISTAGLADFGPLDELTDELIDLALSNKLMGQVADSENTGHRFR
jgi:uncharacterized protein YbjT (DUF2867 family)